MKWAVLSDVHGNVAALEEVIEDIEAWQPDRVVVNGDLVNRGPYSLAALRLVQTHFPGAVFIRGNHENFVIKSADEIATKRVDESDPLFDLKRFSHWTAQQMGKAVDEMRQWLDHLDITESDHASIHITHGSRRGDRDGIHPETVDEELPEKLGDPRHLFVASHTHRPFIRDFEGTLLVNIGSVGAPFDGDPRSSYGRFLHREGRWQAEIIRIAYDRERTVKDFEQSGMLEQGGPLARMMLRELQDATMHIGPWMREYHPRVIAGELSVDEAVNDYLQRLQ